LPSHGIPFKSRRTKWTRAERLLRLTAVHCILHLVDGHLWNALALAAMAGLTAIPADVLNSNSRLRFAVPVVLAVIGMAVKTAANHAEACDRCC
jgi:hypothetical protein